MLEEAIKFHPVKQKYVMKHRKGHLTWLWSVDMAKDNPRLFFGHMNTLLTITVHVWLVIFSTT